MTTIGEPERVTQNRIIALLSAHNTDAPDGLGWRYLGDWQKRDGNTNIEESLLRPWLTARGYAPDVISKAIAELTRARSRRPASNSGR